MGSREGDQLRLYLSLLLFSIGCQRTVVQVAVGLEHTCALLDSGDVRCWGGGSFGQLGYGSKDDRLSAPSEDVPLNGAIVERVAARAVETCVLLDNGRLRCWGDNRYGNLGYGDTESRGDRPETVPVGDIPLGDAKIARIAVGSGHVCTLLSTHQLRCFGFGGEGQLGY